MDTEIKQYFDLKKNLSTNLLIFVDNPKPDDEDYETIFRIIDSFSFNTSEEEFLHFLHLIVSISNNHHRQNDFFDKIDKIIQHIKEDMIQNVSNIKLYHIFESNKRLLLILFESKIIAFDEKVYQQIKYKSEPNGIKYSDFFIPEIKNLNENEETFSNLGIEYEENRRQGENESYICSLIRKDMVEDFISYVNRNSISLSSKVNKSIYETNSFLNENEPTLIEYAAFYGSIQIFQYLYKNNVKVSESIWLYGIHSNNSDFYQNYLNRIDIKPTYEVFKKCMKESIKCHHNDFADFMDSILVHINSSDQVIYEEMKYKSSFDYHNYSFFPNDYEHESLFLYLYQFNLKKIIALILDFKMSKNMNKITIQSAANGNDLLAIYYLLLRLNAIGNIFFAENKFLKQIALPKSIKSIGNNSFKNCASLFQIIIPTSVTYIGYYCFKGCSSLTNISIPSTVTEIKNNTFEGCKSLKQISIPSSVTSIGNNAFNGCISLTQIYIPSSLTSIGNYAFKECSSLAQITLPLSLTSIGDNAFNGCFSLTQISIPPSVTQIKKYTFCKCTALTQITLSSSITSIGDNAFNGCFSLTQISIPSSVTSIGDYAFCDCCSLKQISIPSSISEIGDHTFFSCSSIKQITIPSSVTSIGYSSFELCSSLAQIIIPSSVISIGSHAFHGCSELKQISIPSFVKSIDDYTFFNCSSLSKIKLTSNITSIGNSAFKGCSKLKQISVPSSVASIGENAFKGCSSLTEIKMPANIDLEYIGISQI